MRRLKVGAQLIIWGRRVLEDLPGVLDEVSAIGYEGVETSMDALLRHRDPKGLLEARGLVLAGIHMGIGDREASKRALELLRRLGGRYLIFSGAGARRGTEDEYRQAAEFLNEVGKLAVSYGVKVCYHNHGWEIMNEGFGIKILLEETDPELVFLCMDTYWVKYGGLDPVEFMRENLDRIAYLHLKDGTEEDFRKREFSELGRGIIDFGSIISLAKRGIVEWLIVEQDRTKLTPRESMEISRRYLRESFSL